MTSIYDEFDRATGKLSAYAITRGAEHVGRVVFTHGASVRCFLQVWGAPMVKGTARGGGYDRASAAAANAARKLTAAADDREWPVPDHCRAVAESIFEALKDDDGHGWRRHLEDAGFTVQHVLG